MLAAHRRNPLQQIAFAPIIGGAPQEKISLPTGLDKDRLSIRRAVPGFQHRGQLHYGKWAIACRCGYGAG